MPTDDRAATAKTPRGRDAMVTMFTPAHRDRPAQSRTGQPAIDDLPDSPDRVSPSRVLSVMPMLSPGSKVVSSCDSALRHASAADIRMPDNSINTCSPRQCNSRSTRKRSPTRCSAAIRFLRLNRCPRGNASSNGSFHRLSVSRCSSSIGMPSRSNM